MTQSSVLLGEFDNQWCNDCGDVTLEEYEVTDPAGIAEIDAERARVRVRDAADDLRAAARQAEAALRHAIAASERDALICLCSAIGKAVG